MEGTPVVHRVAGMRLRGPAGPMRARVYWPDRPSGGPVPALLVFLPASGSGPASGCEPDGVDSADALCRGLCSRAGVVVLSVSYRPVPPHPYPAALHDATTTVEWAADHATELDADPGRLMVAGEGFGASLAAAVTRRARDLGWPPLPPFHGGAS